jgi:hypothetical protein
VSDPTPLLDFFKRREVARDVRLLAAQGALAPRAHEQLAILIVLLEDDDPEIRAAAGATLQSIPEATLAGYLARSDVPAEVRQFFGARATVATDLAVPDAAAPLIDVEPDTIDDETPADEEGSRESVSQQLAKMIFP